MLCYLSQIRCYKLLCWGGWRGGVTRFKNGREILIYNNIYWEIIAKKYSIKILVLLYKKMWCVYFCFKSNYVRAFLLEILNASQMINLHSYSFFGLHIIIQILHYEVNPTSKEKLGWFPPTRLWTLHISFVAALTFSRLSLKLRSGLGHHHIIQPDNSRVIFTSV